MPKTSPVIAANLKKQQQTISGHSLKQKQIIAARHIISEHSGSTITLAKAKLDGEEQTKAGAWKTYGEKTEWPISNT